MGETNPRKLIVSNVLVALALFTFLIWMVGDGFNFPNAKGQTANLMAGNVGVEYDSGVFNISDVSIKYDDVWGPIMIGLIENTDPVNKIEGVQLSVQMYDSNDHLIGVMKGYPQSSNILPNQKTAFEIQSGDEDIKSVDHVFIEILASDWGTLSYTPPSSYTPPQSLGSNSSDPPYIGIVGLNLTPDFSKHIGLNQTKGVLLTIITKGSPADKSGLRDGSTTIMYNGTDIPIGGDIILKIDNQSVSKMQDITAYIHGQKDVGDNVTLTILRDNATKKVDVTLGEKPSQGPAVFAGKNDTLQKYFSIKKPVEFTSKDGFSFDYPPNWEVKGRENRFNGFSATLENKLANNNFIYFQYLNKSDLSHLEDKTDKIKIDFLSNAIRDNYEGTAFESGADKYIINNKTAPYVIGVVDKCNTLSYCSHYAIMQIFIRLNESGVIGQYIAQQDDFDMFLNQTEKIFQSVRQ